MTTPAPDMAMFLVRIGDAERDACIELLAEHHARGRLTADELDRRQNAALTAVTGADLAALVADLPAVRPGQPMLVQPPRSATALSHAPAVARRVGRRLVAPVFVVTGGVLVAWNSPMNDPEQFSFGAIAALLGYAGGYAARWLDQRRTRAGRDG